MPKRNPEPKSKSPKTSSAPNVPSVPSSRRRANRPKPPKQAPPNELDDGLPRSPRPQVNERVREIRAELLASIEKGNFPAVAAQAQGVPIRTWTTWRTWADEGDPLFVDLFEQVSCALARAEEKLVARLMNPKVDTYGRSDRGYIHSTQFLLERTRRERWGDKLEVKVHVEDSMRALLEELETKMSKPAFDELVVALSELEMDGGA